MFIKGSSGVGSHPKLHTYEEGFLLPVLTAEELLSSSRHKGLLRQIRDLTPEFSQADFDRSYGKLIFDFMEFVQLLPHKSNGIIGSLLNYSLARAVATIQKYCLSGKSNITPLLKFAVFSAALLKDVGRVWSNQRIVMTDPDSEFFRDWNPMSGTMLGQTQFYKMYPISAAYLKIEKESTPLLARQLIPHDVFLWLSNDPVLFADWLAALLGEEGVGAKEISLTIALIKREDIIAILNTLDGAAVDMLPPTDPHADAFYHWLKDGIEKGDIAVNTDDAAVHVVNEGVLIEKKIFKQFAELSKLPVNFAVVFTQFGNLMGIASKGGNDYLHAAYFSPGETASSLTTFSAAGGQKVKSIGREGMVVDVKDIFVNKDVPSQSTLKSAKTMTSSHHHSLAQTENPSSQHQNTQKQ
jgi:Putative helicase/Putative conjugal transfer nickase/helicase TraI C-term